MVRAKKSILIVHLMESRLRLLSGHLSVWGFELGDHLDLERDILHGGIKEGAADELSREMEKFCLHHSLRSPKVIIALSRRFLIWRLFSVPPVAQDKLQDLVEYEIEKHLPIRKEEVYYRFAPLSKGKEGWQILLVGTKKGFIKELESALEMIGLRPSAVIPDICGYTFLLKDQGLELKSGYPAIAYIGEGDIEMALLREDLPLFYRVFKTEEGESDSPLSQSTEYAHQAQIMARGIDAAVDEAAPILPAGEKIETAFIFGTTPGGDWLASKLDNKHVKRWQTIKKGDLNRIIYHQGEEEQPRLLATIGLVIGANEAENSPLNMLPRGIAEKWRKPRLRTAAFFMALFLVAAGAYYGSIFFARHQELLALEREISDLKTRVQAVQSLSDKARENESKLKTLEELLMKDNLIISVLRELTRLIPVSVYLNQVTLSGGSVEISGFADSASELISLLEASSIFKNVSFAAPITSRGQDKERFKIKLDLEA